MKKLSVPLIGFLQAVGILLYILLIVVFFTLMGLDGTEPDVPEFIIAGTMILLFVFSAAVTGGLFLGYPAILVMKGKVRKGVAIIGFELLWLFIVLLVAVTTVIAF